MINESTHIVSHHSQWNFHSSHSNEISSQFQFSRWFIDWDVWNEVISSIWDCLQEHSHGELCVNLYITRPFSPSSSSSAVRIERSRPSPQFSTAFNWVEWIETNEGELSFTSIIRIFTWKLINYLQYNGLNTIASAVWPALSITSTIRESWSPSWKSIIDMVPYD